MISVIVPLYNYRRFIKDNIESIKSQSINSWELIIVDDCSTDNPYPVIKPYLKSNIKYIKLDKNIGYGSAKNVGLREAAGEWVVILDADDMLTKKSLKVRVKALENSNKKWCHAKAYEFGGLKPPYKFKVNERKSFLRFKKMLKNGKYKNIWKSIHAQTVMVHMDVYRQVGLYEPSLRSMGDKEMWARISNNVGRPLFVDSYVANYRQHKGQMHRSKKKLKNLVRFEKILNKCIKKRKSGNLDGALALWDDC